MAVNCRSVPSLQPKKELMNIEVPLSSKLIKLPLSVYKYVEEKAKMCQPDNIHLCDGSEEEYSYLLELLENKGAIKRLKNNKFVRLSKIFISI